jgi:hypothetical protein
MYEIFPVMAGIVLALLIQPLDGSRSKPVALAAGSVAIGAVASFVSGELFVSWGFLAIDIALVLAAATATTILVAWLRRSRELR